jgi:uncharacterized protein YbjQ (UPF0145 family)
MSNLVVGEKYDVITKDEKVLSGLSSEEIADQLRSGNIDENAQVSIHGSSRVSQLNRLVPEAVRLANQKTNPKADEPISTLSIMLTTEPIPQGFKIIDRKEIITAECAFGMNIFRDFFAGVRDFFGGRSSATQAVLRDSRRKVLEELRKEASHVGANAVIGVSLAYNEFSGQNKSMLFVVATGTAVTLEKVND